MATLWDGTLTTRACAARSGNARLTVVTKDTVPPFGPPLPNPPVITDMTLLRRLLLSKRT